MKPFAIPIHPHTTKFIDNCLKLLPIHVKLNGKAAWDSSLTNLQRQIVSERVKHWDINSGIPTGSTTPQYYRCPKCQHLESSQCKSFQTVDLDTKQQCNACRVSTTVNLWKCRCNIYWHRCSSHRTQYHAVYRHLDKTKRQIADTSPDTVPKKPRAFGDGVYENLLVEDQGRAKRKNESLDWPSEPTIILGTHTIKGSVSTTSAHR